MDHLLLPNNDYYYFSDQSHITASNPSLKFTHISILSLRANPLPIIFYSPFSNNVWPPLRVLNLIPSQVFVLVDITNPSINCTTSKSVPNPHSISRIRDITYRNDSTGYPYCRHPELLAHQAHTTIHGYQG